MTFEEGKFINKTENNYLYYFICLLTNLAIKVIFEISERDRFYIRYIPVAVGCYFFGKL